MPHLTTPSLPEPNQPYQTLMALEEEGKVVASNQEKVEGEDTAPVVEAMWRWR